MDRNEIIALMKKAVFSAGNLIKDSLHKGKNVSYEHKLSYDYVTETDRKSENVISAILKEACPGDVVIGEESFDGARLPDGSFWVVDPLDGTTNFIHGFPVISVTITRFEKGKATAGCIYDPLRDELFIAVKNYGVFLNGTRIRTLNKGIDVAHSLVATGFPFRRKDLIRPYLMTFEEIFRQVSDIRRTGSAALDLAYLAVGRIDGFWEIGLKPWDTATGILMIEELGGIVSDFHGTRKELETGNIIAASNRAVYEVILKAVRNHLLPFMTE